MTALPDDFDPAPGLAHTHAQTVFALYRRKSPSVPWKRQRQELPDGDFIDVDRLPGNEGMPTLLVLHGLEGSTSSGYVGHIAFEAQARGWNVAALNFRSCSGEPNRLLRSYSSGDFRDVEWLLERTTGPTFAVGFSLGGSVLLNYLAKARGKGLAGAVAVSAPYDLDDGAARLDAPNFWSRRYVREFLGTMKAKALAKAARFPGAIDAKAVQEAATIRAFDACVTAPLFGYDSAEAYYRDCSAGPLLTSIDVPTLLISSRDDHIAPASQLPRGALGTHRAVHVLETARGGHNGFVGGTVLRPRFWVERRAVDWLSSLL